MSYADINTFFSGIYQKKIFRKAKLIKWYVETFGTVDGWDIFVYT